MKFDRFPVRFQPGIFDTREEEIKKYSVEISK